MEHFGSENGSSGAAASEPVMMPSGETRVVREWHALYTRHQHEKITARILAEKGIEVFLPLYTVAHRWKDRTKKLTLPLFPCYVFFQGALDRRPEILSTAGVCSLVRCGNGIAAIPEWEIRAVHRVVKTSTAAEPYPFLRCGDRVRVRFGPLAGLEGILLRRKDDLRLILSVELLRRSIAVDISGSAVVPASRPVPADVAVSV